MSQNNKYSIGLDIGTNSVGWAVIKDDYLLDRYKHQNMWGVNLFPNAETAEDTRLKRSSRRRQKRRKLRLAQLTSFFEPEVHKVDPVFFHRLSESMLIQKDKQKSQGVNIVFNDPNFDDKKYHELYPTIYHLRQDLIRSTDKKDIRLVYLALHHIIKYRGNFLRQGQAIKLGEGDKSIHDTLKGLFEYGEEFFDNAPIEVEDVGDDVIEILLNRKLKRQERSNELVGLLSSYWDDLAQLKAVAKAVLGLNFKVGDLLKNPDLKKESLSFDSTNYEDNVDKIASLVDEHAMFLEDLKLVYDWQILNSILNNHAYLSDGMVSSYDKFGNDLKNLKKLIADFAPKQKTLFMRKSDGKTVNFANYMTHPGEFSDRKKLYAAIEKLFAENSAALSSKGYEYFKEQTELDDYLVRQRIRENGAIPYQIHQAELEKIIDNQSAYYPFLAENKDKIVSILTFRIPYYIGPLKDGGRFAWSVKKAEGEIFPWNFYEKIDRKASAESFIDNLRNFCTYLPGQETLPKNSLLYAEFEVLNELKNLRINGKPMSIDAQQQLVEDLFKKQKTVSLAALRKWLKLIRYTTETGDYEIDGLAKSDGFASSLVAYNDFVNRLGLSVSGKNRSMVEEIIKWITLFEDKDILKSNLEKYKDQLSEDQLAVILKLRYKGWGRLSRKLLTGLKTKNEALYGESIMDRLRSGDLNFMQLISSDKLDFKKQIEDANQYKDTEVTYEIIKKLAGSPAIKRGIWRAVRIINEIVDLQGCPPEAIYLEMARNKEESRRTKSRSQQLKEMYNNFKKEADEENLSRYNNSIKGELKQYENLIHKEKVFLYFLQNGKCAYSGKPLSYELDNDLVDCEVDHVFPRSLVKDDSINNKVLVLKKYNQEKGDEYPLSDEIVRRMFPFWQMLKNSKMMSAAKFYRLIDRRQLTEKQVAGFINRQLVETRQITKRLIGILEGRFNQNQKESKVKISAVRAGLASDFRWRFGLPKCREINDFHHAKDAYLAAVIGQYAAKRYPNLESHFVYKEYQRFYSKKSRKDFNTNFLIASMSRDGISNDGEYTWDSKGDLDRIIKTMKYNDCLVTKMQHANKGQFYDIQLVSREKAKIPRKAGLDLSYGGYKGVQDAYFVAIEFVDKKKLARRIVGIPIQVMYAAKNGTETIEEYLQKTYGNDVKILKSTILKNQKIIRNDSLQYITSGTEVANAKQLTLPWKYERAVAKLLAGYQPKTVEQAKELDDLLVEFFDVFVEKLRTQYQKIYPRFAELVGSHREVFVKMPLADKRRFTKELLCLTKAASSMSNFKSLKKEYKEIKLSDRMERLSRQPLHLDDIILIHESITGLLVRKEFFKKPKDDQESE